MIVSLVAIYFIRKVKQDRSDFVFYGLILFYNIMVNIYFWIDPKNPLIQIQFLYTIAFSHIIRLISFFYVSFVCLISAILFLNIRISTIQESKEDEIDAGADESQARDTSSSSANLSL